MIVRVVKFGDKTDVFIGGWPLKESVATIAVAIEIAKTMGQKELNVVTFLGKGKHQQEQLRYNEIHFS